MKHYLITGGCGFLGSNIAARLIREGRRVTVVDNLYRVGAERNLKWLRENGSFTFHYGDVRNADDVEAAFLREKPDAVFHLAGQVAMTTSLERPRFDFEINALGSLNVLEAVRRHCPQAAVVYSSTNKVYGDLENLSYEETPSRFRLKDLPEGLPESTPLDFHSPYGCSKGAADQYMLDWARMFGLRTIVFRHSSMYGGRQFATSDQGWIGWFVQKALEQSQGSREPFTISGSGKQVRDLLHAEDMVDLYLKAAASAEAHRGQAFNIGGGMANSLSILELLDFLSNELAVRLNFTHIAPRESDQLVFVADHAKARKAFDWSPRVDWRTGVRKMISWVSSEMNGL